MTKKRSFIGADGQLIEALEPELPLDIPEASDANTRHDPFDHPDDPGPCITVDVDDDGIMHWQSPHHQRTRLTGDSYVEFVEALHGDAYMHRQRYGYPSYSLPTKFNQLARRTSLHVARQELLE